MVGLSRGTHYLATPVSIAQVKILLCCLVNNDLTFVVHLSFVPISAVILMRLASCFTQGHQRSRSFVVRSAFISPCLRLLTLGMCHLDVY